MSAASAGVATPPAAITPATYDASTGALWCRSPNANLSGATVDLNGSATMNLSTVAVRVALLEPHEQHE